MKWSGRHVLGCFTSFLWEKEWRRPGRPSLVFCWLVVVFGFLVWGGCLLALVFDCVPLLLTRNVNHFLSSMGTFYQAIKPVYGSPESPCTHGFHSCQWCSLQDDPMVPTVQVYGKYFGFTCLLTTCWKIFLECSKSCAKKSLSKLQPPHGCAQNRNT